MNKILLYSVAVVSAVLFISCNGDKNVKYSISGTWEDKPNEVVLLAQDNDASGYNMIDSATTDANGKFYFEGKVNYPQRLSLFFVKESKDVDLGSPIGVFVDGTPITVNVQKPASASFSITDIEASVTGSKQQHIIETLQGLNLMYGFMLFAAAADSENDYEEKFNQAVLSFLDSARNEIASTYIISDLLIDNFPPDTTFKYFNNLSKHVKESELGKRLEQRINLMKSLANGGNAPNFTLKDISGNEFILSSLKGNYVLLDFWASWCSPCRAEIPNLKNIYNKYRDAGLKIVSVSLDEKANDWEKAVKEEGLDWIQVSSLTGFNCPVAKAYNVSAIPAIFVLDKNGKILFNKLRGKELADAIDGLFK